MKIGTTTFGFRYSFMDPANSPKLAEVIRQAKKRASSGCRCARTPARWKCRKWRVGRSSPLGAELGVELLLGCKTLLLEVVERYLRLAQELGVTTSAS